MADSIQELPSNNPLTNRFFLTPEEKKSKEAGKAMVKAFYLQQTGTDNTNYYVGRKARQIELLLWAKGSQPMKEFLDYMSISDANKAWVNIDNTPTRIAAQFLGTLVESMAKQKTYPCVEAIDDGSINEKEQRQFDALFRMHEIEVIKSVQEAAGMEIEPPNAYVPDDELSAKVYFQIEDKLPKEIRFEKMLKSVRDAVQYEKVLSRKGIYDLITLNVEITKIEKVSPKNYTVRKCIPTNCIWNFFMNDTGDCEVTLIGEFYNLKVRDFRKRFGKSEERPEGLTEEEIWKLAKESSIKAIGKFNYLWNTTYSYDGFNNYNRPYDDASILVLDCEIDCGEDQYFVSKKDAYGKEDIQKKQNVPYQQKKKDGTIINQDKPEDVEIIKKKKQTWMRGVYAPYGDTMLYWGKPDLIITPYTDVYKSLSSYSINIPNNDGEYVPSLFERILEPLREYQLTKLKRKQLIAQIRPSGIRIDVESARNIDLGNGDSIAWEEVLRIFNQTGTEVWSSKGLDPLSKESPAITNTAADESIGKVMELTNILASIVVEIRQLIGVPQYRDGSDVGDRTSGVLQEQQNISSYNVTDFILNAHDQLWDETDYKLCLLHWMDIVKEEPETKDDLLNTRFYIRNTSKSTDYQKQIIERDIDRYSQVQDKAGNPLISPTDAMLIREIDNFKEAYWFLQATIKRNKREAEESSARLQKQNAEVQSEVAQQSAAAEADMQAKKLDAEKQMKDFESTKAKELALLNGVLLIASKGLGIPPEMQGLVQLLVPNIAIPLAMENKQMGQQVQQQNMEEADAVAHQYAQSQQSQPEEQGEQQIPPQQPQQDSNAQPQMQPQ